MVKTAAAMLTDNEEVPSGILDGQAAQRCSDPHTSPHAPNLGHPFVQGLHAWRPPEQAVGPPPQISSLTGLHLGARPHLNFTVNGVQLKMLIDSGATVSIIKAVHLDAMRPKPAKVSPATKIRVADAGLANSPGKFLCKVEGNNISCSFAFHALDSLAQDALLGSDFLRLNQGIINYGDLSVSLQGTATAWAEAAVAGRPPAAPTAAPSCVAEHQQIEYALAAVHTKSLGEYSTTEIEASIRTPNHIQFKPGATVLITTADDCSWVALEGLYAVREKNRVKFVLVNITPTTTYMHQGKHIAGITARTVSDLVLQPASQQEVLELVATGEKPPGKPERPMHKCKPEKEKYIKANLDLSRVESKWQSAYLEWALENHDVFSESPFHVGYTPHYAHKVHLKTNDAIYQQQFNIPLEQQGVLTEFIKNMLQAKIIVECRSIHNVPLFLVRKSNQKNAYRVVCDFRKCNSLSVSDRFAVMDVRATLNAVGRNRPRVFSGLDLTSAYFCLRLADDSQQITAFTIPFMAKQYKFIRTPMGMQGSAASFSRLMSIVLEGLSEICTNYIDDVILHVRTHTEMIAALNQVAARLRVHGLLLNPAKTHLGRCHIQFLGFELSQWGISPAKSKCVAISAMAPPETVKEVEAVLGLFGYFRSLIKNFSAVAAPLTALTSTTKSNPTAAAHRFATTTATNEQGSENDDILREWGYPSGEEEAAAADSSHSQSPTNTFAGFATPAQSPEQAAAASSPQTPESERQQRLLEEASKVQLPGSNIWSTIAAASSSFVPTILQQESSTSSAKGARPKTRNEGVPPGKYGPFNQVFHPNK